MSHNKIATATRLQKIGCLPSLGLEDTKGKARNKRKATLILASSVRSITHKIGR